MRAVSEAQSEVNISIIQMLLSRGASPNCSLIDNDEVAFSVNEKKHLTLIEATNKEEK